MHVAAGEGECQFWLEPIAQAQNRGLSAATIRKIEALIYEHQDLLREKYREHHGR